ncbi:hypothetical protein GCM10018963_74500 [Saccharothrix longispora]
MLQEISESGGQTSAGVAVAQVGEHQQCLATGIQAPPPGPTTRPLRADRIGQADKGAVGQRNRGRVRTARRGSRLGHRILVDCCLTGSLAHHAPHYSTAP